MKKKTKPTSIRLEPVFEEDLKEKCKGLGCSKSEYLQEAGKFMVYGSSEFNFGDNEEENSQDQENTQEERPRPTARLILESENKPKTFECKNGNLYENGSLIGSCSNYDLNDGKVYDKNGKYLGQIQNNSKPHIVEV